jgi:hypothetical protein
MQKDESYALMLFAVLLLLVSQEDINIPVSKFLLELSRPISTALILAALYLVFKQGLHYTFLVLLVISVYLLRELWSTRVLYDSRLYYDLSRDEARFNPNTSLDIQLATGAVQLPTSLTRNIGYIDNLLIYPPSFETLKELSG